MPIEITIDPDARIIYSTCVGIMTQEDFVEYQKWPWSDNSYYGFNELFDASQADWSGFNFSFLFTIAENASKLDTLDPQSKLAFVILEGKQKELTDFYKAAKSAITDNSRQLQAFYSREEALSWLTE